MVIKQTFCIIVAAVVLGLGVNLVSPNSIAYIGQYRSLSSGDGPVVPPDASEGDPPFIAIDVAEMEFSNSDVLFVDARDPEEFNCGTIPGAVNLPFDYLPEDNLETYIDSTLEHLDKDHGMIVFCSGEECDLSLHLGRNLQDLGYNKVAIFFGGAREWEDIGLEMERREDCGE